VRRGPGDKGAIAAAQVSVRDGLAAVAAAAPRRYDAIVVDAGSGDAAAAMSCPPPAFLAADFLQQVRASQAAACGTAVDADPKPPCAGQ
jgi:hypothetical protein